MKFLLRCMAFLNIKLWKGLPGIDVELITTIQNRGNGGEKNPHSSSPPASWPAHFHSTPCPSCNYRWCTEPTKCITRTMQRDWDNVIVLLRMPFMWSIILKCHWLRGGPLLEVTSCPFCTWVQGVFLIVVKEIWSGGRHLQNVNSSIRQTPLFSCDYSTWEKEPR